VNRADLTNSGAERLHGDGPTVEALFAAAAGRLPSDAAEWVSSHAQGCETCRVALERARAARAALAAPAEAPFQRARDLAAVRRRLEARQPRRWQRWLLLGGGALAAASVALFVGLRRPGKPTEPDFAMEVVARAGAATLAPAGAPPVAASAHDRATVGSTLEVAAGGRLVARWGGARVVLDGSAGPARLRLQASRGSERRLLLDEGRVLLDVDPLPQGTTLAVATPRGEVVVRGTIFLVEHGAQGSGAAVLRGRVDVRRDDRTWSLTAGQRLAPDQSEPTALDDETAKVLGAVPSSASAGEESVDIFADVAEARVTVDGVARGRQPVSLALAAGVHRVRVEATGYQALEEQLQVTPGVPTLFRADLRPVAVAAPRAARRDTPARSDEPRESAAREPAVKDTAPRSVGETLTAARADLVAGRTQRAIDSLEGLRRRGLNPTERSRVLLVLGQAERMALRPERAASCFHEAATGEGPEAEQAQVLLAQTLGRDLGDHRRAADAWATAEKRFPRGVLSSEVAFRLGESLLAAGETREGIAQLERYLATHSSSGHVGEAHLLVGAARRDRLNDCVGALPHFEAVTGLGGSRAEAAWVAAARCQAKLGRAADARRTYQRYLSAFPDGTYADEARGK
jgi:tetratricopeptide (TPR) repeat protein